MPFKNKILSKIKSQLEHCPEAESRRKLELFLRALEGAGVVEACRQLGKAPRFYYYWWNRYRDSGFRLQALRHRSRRPKHHPRQTPPHIVAWIESYAPSDGPEAIRRRLEQDHQVRLSRSTIYRILRSRGPKQTSPHRRPHRERQDRGAAPIQSHRPSPHTPAEPFAGRYRVEKELGRGGAGVVYLAQDLRTRRPVALKLLECSEATPPELIASLHEEFIALSELRHPNLARVFDFGRTPSEVYFTSEYIAGRDLLAAAREANLNTVFRLFTQVLSALDYLHGRGILHLDLKPSNLLVAEASGDQEPRVQLIDFGGAQWRRKGLGQGREFAGTPPYSAPELLLGQAPSPATDLYALGMLAYQIFAGAFPFEAQDPVALMKEQVYGEAKTSVALHPALPESFGDFLARLVARDPARRFSTARQALAALNECLGENFSWPAHFGAKTLLEACDFDFHPRVFTAMQAMFDSDRAAVGVLSGPPASGKSRLLSRLKRHLQLRGTQVQWVSDRAGLEALGNHPPNAFSEALLIDGIEFEPDELVPWLDRLENWGRPTLIATRLEARAQFNPQVWMELPTFTEGQWQDFFTATVRGFPRGRAAEAFRASEGNLAGLERLLEAMVEEGLIQDSDAGWAWQTESDLPFAELLTQNEAHWAEHRAQALELLGFAPQGLGINTLARILGLAPESLAARLAEWERAGLLRSRRRRQEIRYHALPAKDSPRNTQVGQNWAWARAELELLYQQGRFTEGAELFRVLRAPTTPPSRLPHRVALIGARHLVAAGWGEEALQALPPADSLDPEARGLACEVQARAFFLLARAEPCRERLTAGEAAYRETGDRLGLSRLANLRGSLCKRAGDLPAAERAFQEAIALGAAGGDAYHQAIAAMNLAILQQDLGNWERAQQIYREAFALEAGLEQPLLSCKLRNNWINLLVFLGRSQEAEAGCYDLLSRALRARYPDQQAAALSYLALLAGQRGDPEGQLNFLQQALALIQAAQYPQLYFQCLLDRGQACLERGRFTAAQIDAEGAEAAARRNANPVWTAMAQILLGRVYRDRPRPDLAQASRAFNEAHLVAWSQKNRSLLWEIDYERGLLAERRGDTERARRYFTVAQQTLQEVLAGLPEPARAGFLRDRKGERLQAALEQLPKPRDR
ncbi:MAG: protein kinase [bacterium]